MNVRLAKMELAIAKRQDKFDEVYYCIEGLENM